MITPWFPHRGVFLCRYIAVFRANPDVFYINLHAYKKIVYRLLDNTSPPLPPIIKFPWGLQISGSLGVLFNKTPHLVPFDNRY